MTRKLINVLKNERKQSEVIFPSMNLLKKLHKRQLDLRKANLIYKKYAFSEKSYKIWKYLLSLSNLEVYSFVAGVDFKTLAKWRYEGWPNTCYLCHKNVMLRKNDWWLVKHKRSKYEFYHVKCKILNPDKNQKIDLLKELYYGRVTKKAAYELLNKAIDYLRMDKWWELFGFSRNELKAYAAPIKPNLKTLAKWRYEGWPNKCYFCGNKLNVNKSTNWWINKNKEGKSVLKHLKCGVNKNEGKN